MQTFRLLATILVLDLSCGLACASSVQSSDAMAATGPKKPVEKQVCKAQARTGTRFVKEVCKTRTQWTEEAEQARREAQDEIGKPRPNLASGN